MKDFIIQQKMRNEFNTIQVFYRMMNILGIVAIAVFRQVEGNSQVLLLKREKPPYMGNHALPGGKIEVGERLDQAVKRELLEETGLEPNNFKIIGFLNETLVNEDDILSGHFLITYFKCNVSNHLEIIQSEEGQLYWVDIDNLSSLQDTTIPSDYRILEQLINNQSIIYGSEKGEENQSVLYFEGKIRSYSLQEGYEKLELLEWQVN